MVRAAAMVIGAAGAYGVTAIAFAQSQTAVSKPIVIPGTNELIGVATTIQQTGPNPYLLALIGVTLMIVLSAFLWFSRTNQATVGGMIKGAEERAKEDRSMYREEAKQTRDTFKFSLERMALSHEQSIGKLSDGLNRVSDSVDDLEHRLGEIAKDKANKQSPPE